MGGAGPKLSLPSRFGLQGFNTSLSLAKDHKLDPLHGGWFGETGSPLCKHINSVNFFPQLEEWYEAQTYILQPRSWHLIWKSWINRICRALSIEKQNGWKFEVKVLIVSWRNSHSHTNIKLSCCTSETNVIYQYT